MDDPSAIKVTLRAGPIFKLLFWGVVVPIAALTLLAVGYVVFVLGVEHY
jgi:hypothetical protein